MKPHKTLKQLIKAAYTIRIEPEELAELGEDIADYFALTLAAGFVAGFMLFMFLNHLMG